MIESALIHILLALSSVLGPVHPQDGPDVDLRVRVDRDRVEVRAVVNLAFCDEVAGTPRQDPDYVDPDELPALRRDLEAIFRSEVTVSVDGEKLEADRFDFEELPWEPEDAEFFPQMGMRAVVKFAVALRFELEEPPRSVGLVWGLYPRNIALAEFVDEKIEVKAEWSAGREVLIVDLNEREPEFIWHAPAGSFERPTLAREEVVEEEAAPKLLLGFLPAMLALVGLAVAAFAGIRPGRKTLVVVLVCVAVAGIVTSGVLFEDAETPAELDDAEMAELFEERLRGIYDAFSFSEESDVYDALAACVSDDAIGPLYDQVHASLVMREEGGAVGRVQELTPVAIEVVENDAEDGRAKIDARWKVLGQVYHWGHTHTRLNAHHARYEMRRTPTGWLIEAAEPISQERLASGTEGS